jgi:hypothetical protein
LEEDKESPSCCREFEGKGNKLGGENDLGDAFEPSLERYLQKKRKKKKKKKKKKKVFGTKSVFFCVAQRWNINNSIKLV